MFKTFWLSRSSNRQAVGFQSRDTQPFVLALVILVVNTELESTAMDYVNLDIILAS